MVLGLSLAPQDVFLLSPANCAGRRAGLLLRPDSKLELAVALRSAEGASLGEVYAFMSSLYFRGKLAYARRFARAPLAVSSVLVITPGRGLCPASQRVTWHDLQAIAAVEVDVRNAAYTQPLYRDAAALAALTTLDTRFVLLGSIATDKYVGPLQRSLGSQLYFPSEFVGRGDMSRGGLMLRCAREGRPLDYFAVSSAVRHGPRAARLPRLPRTAAAREGDSEDDAAVPEKFSD